MGPCMLGGSALRNAPGTRRKTSKNNSPFRVVHKWKGVYTLSVTSNANKNATKENEMKQTLTIEADGKGLIRIAIEPDRKTGTVHIRFGDGFTLRFVSTADARLLASSLLVVAGETDRDE